MSGQPEDRKDGTESAGSSPRKPRSMWYYRRLAFVYWLDSVFDWLKDLTFLLVILFVVGLLLGLLGWRVYYSLHHRWGFFPDATAIYAQAQEERGLGQQAQNAGDAGEAADHFAKAQGLIAKAVDKYQSSCNRSHYLGGNTTDCINLGEMYLFGSDVPKDVTRGAGLLQKACDNGDSTGCVDLGKRYRDGDLLPQNLTLARQLLQKACKDKDNEGCDALKDPKFQ